MDNFAEKLIKKIDNENIKPKSRFSYDFKKIIDIIIFIFIVLLDSLLLSLIFFFIRECSMDLDVFVNQSILFFLPYFWITLFLGIIVISYFYFFYKLKGYRLNPVILLLVIGFITFGLAFGMSSINNFNEEADEVLSVNMPFYYNTIVNDDPWHDYIGGKVLGRLSSIKIDNNRNVINLVDNSNNIIFTAFYDGDIRNVYNCNFIINNRYKVIAQRTFDGNYKILEIRSWHSDECPKKR